MKKIVFATHNSHKLEEIKDILGAEYEVLGLNDINCLEDIPETGDTLEENALLKARYVKEKYGYDCFADDTGLEVYALDNAPGVYSARYAGDSKDSLANMKKVLKELETKQDRRAQFRTIISLILGDKIYRFEGKIEGEVIEAGRGNTGFGYDPIFVPNGYSETFAELGSEIKNKISHRSLAVNKLKAFLL
ncbi:MAG: non-canonical purine NTP diphosphatase [Dysgonamonadaceae bacterium]|jgi:XTP/dITP diphosphohydrolase|nr:non-canonical purine NTP diphosphatase [Dysgonamonadaceae bacterium]